MNAMMSNQSWLKRLSCYPCFMIIYHIMFIGRGEGSRTLLKQFCRPLPSRRAPPRWRWFNEHTQTCRQNAHKRHSNSRSHETWITGHISVFMPLERDLMSSCWIHADNQRVELWNRMIPVTCLPSMPSLPIWHIVQMSRRRCNRNIILTVSESSSRHWTIRRKYRHEHDNTWIHDCMLSIIILRITARHDDIGCMWNHSSA